MLKPSEIPLIFIPAHQLPSTTLQYLNCQLLLKKTSPSVKIDGEVVTCNLGGQDNVVASSTLGEHLPNVVLDESRPQRN